MLKEDPFASDPFSIMAGQVKEPIRVSAGVFEVDGRINVESVVPDIIKVAEDWERDSQGLNKISILTGTAQPAYVALLIVWIGPTGLRLDIPKASWFVKKLKQRKRLKIMIESGRFELSCRHISNGSGVAGLCQGNTVSLRVMRFQKNARLNDMISYCCLTVMQSYFRGLKNLLCHSFYGSLDTEINADTQMCWIGLTVWEKNADNAESFGKNELDGMMFFRCLGAQHLAYHVFKVVYVSPSSTIPAFPL